MLGLYLTIAMLGAAADAAPADELQFDYFRNSWNVIGLKDYAHGTRVTPDNELLLGEGRRAQIRFGRSRTPLSRAAGQTPAGRLAADHPAGRRRRAGPVRIHAVGHAAADGQGLAAGLRLADRRRELLELDCGHVQSMAAGSPPRRRWKSPSASRRPSRRRSSPGPWPPASRRTASCGSRFCPWPTRSRWPPRTPRSGSAAPSTTGRDCWPAPRRSRCPAARPPRPCGPPTSAS